MKAVVFGAVQHKSSNFQEANITGPFMLTGMPCKQQTVCPDAHALLFLTLWLLGRQVALQDLPEGFDALRAHPERQLLLHGRD